MSVDIQVILIVLNIAATVGGIFKLWLSFERRITTMETHLQYHLPKRKNDNREKYP